MNVGLAAARTAAAARNKAMIYARATSNRVLGVNVRRNIIRLESEINILSQRLQILESRLGPVQNTRISQGRIIVPAAAPNARGNATNARRNATNARRNATNARRNANT